MKKFLDTQDCINKVRIATTAIGFDDAFTKAKASYILFTERGQSGKRKADSGNRLSKFGSKYFFRRSGIKLFLKSLSSL